MNNTLTIKFNAKDKKVFGVLMLCVFAFAVLALIQDLLRSHLKHSAFYFSESFMFSSFWWIFAPLLFAQSFVARQQIRKRLHFKLILILVPIVVHLFAFPFLIWLLSSVFYYHTFAFGQTLQYTLSEHLYQIVLMYTIPVLTYPLLAKLIQPVEKVRPIEKEHNANNFIDTILVADGNRKLNVLLSEVLYFSASPPYISIHLDDKKYLHAETLKSVLLKLHTEQFVRVHKSTIVNIKMVASYTTRLNGDYDVTMKNKVQLRVSRNFAADFKHLFHLTHHLTVK